MKIIKNKYLPPAGYSAINLFGIVFTRKETLSERLLRHEAIHTAQMKERFYVFFYLLYLLEFVVLLIRYGNWNKAYRSVSFEREAYRNEDDETYLINRNVK